MTKQERINQLRETQKRIANAKTVNDLQDALATMKSLRKEK